MEAATGMGTKTSTAVAYTITYCKEHGILKKFLENLSPEEVNMLATEWKLEDALRIREEEGEQRGIQIGEQRGRQEEKLETAKNLKSLGIAMEYITRATGLSYDKIAKL
jgi:predicted transposase/invertase (TIGR01784 family)